MKSEKVYELKVTVEDINPEIWRLMIVPENTSLYELHHILQIAFGWENKHLYSFSKDDKEFGNPDLLEDVEVINDGLGKLNDVLLKVNDKMEYLYDLGDSWLHSIVVEKIVPNEADIKNPVCLDGDRACPPEDCGGSQGYAELLEVLRNKKHPQHKELKGWVGEVFDPEQFNIQKVNTRLKTLKTYILNYEADL